MTYVATLSAAVLAAVFGSAAAGKLTALEGFALTIRRLGVPRELALPGAFFVIATEVVAFFLYALYPSPRLAAGVALALLGLFTAAAIRAHLGRLSVPCNCFGSPSSYELGLSTLATTAALTALVGSCAVATEVSGRTLVGVVQTLPLAAALMLGVTAFRLLRAQATEPLP